MGAEFILHRKHRIFGVALAALVVCFMGTAPAFAQKNKKDQPPQPQPTMLSDSKESLLNLPDDKLIDNQISEMLGAWEVGDVDKLHACYADDVLVVSGGAQPPISGWANYLAAYQAERSHMRGVRVERTNTYTKVTGNTAWSTYQWDFTGAVDGTNTLAHGHTTLEFEKRDGDWLIVLNHTSLAEGAPTAPATKSGTP